MKEFSYGIIPIHKINHEYLFLLVHHNQGHWGFPKGHKQKKNESNLKAAQREFMEETGVVTYDVKHETNFRETYHLKKNNELVIKQVEYYIAIVPSTTLKIQTEEIQDAGWFSYLDAHDKLTFQSSKNLILEAKEYIDKYLIDPSLYDNGDGDVTNT